MKNILKKYQGIKAKKPKMRAYNIAQELGISEAELVASRVGIDVIKLSDNADLILKDLEDLGELMSLTRNHSCVHETIGIYKNGKFSISPGHNIGIFVNPGTDLRLFMNQWKHSFALAEKNDNGLVRKSLQFFGKQGQAIHKIFLTKSSNEEAYDKLVEKYKAKQEKELKLESYPEKEVPLEDSSIDIKGLDLAWRSLKDTHDFFPMLKKFKLTREQSFRLIGNEFAYRVANDSPRRVLSLAAENKCEIMVFVGNVGCIQIFTGAVNKLVEYQGWYNVLDSKFNLHLSEKDIVNTWVTKKPTVDGIVTALEVFDKEGNTILTLFGKRKPGIAELDLWRQVISQLPILN